MKIDSKAVHLGASTVSRSEIDLYWSPLVEVKFVKAERYELQVRKGCGRRWGEVELVDKGQWFNHRHSGLNAGRRYHFRIRAHFEKGSPGEWSDEVSAVTKDAGIVGVVKRLFHRI